MKSCKVGFRYSYISIVFTVVKGIPLAKNLWLTDLLNRYPSSFLYYHLELKILFPSIFSLFDQLLLSHQFVSLKSNLWLFLSKLQLQHSDLFYQRYYESFQQLFLQGYLKLEWSLTNMLTCLNTTEPLQGGNLLLTTKFPVNPSTHLIDLRKVKSWVDLRATWWFWTLVQWTGNHAPQPLSHCSIIKKYSKVAKKTLINNINIAALIIL